MLWLSGDEKADALLTKDPLALLMGMVLDQQIPLEKAFKGPYDLKRRIGGKLDAARLAAMDVNELEEVFKKPPALHRFPAANAKRVQELCEIVVNDYGGKADRLWKDAKDGEDLLNRVRQLPGFGEQKSKIFVALLGKQLGVQPPGWREAAGEYAVEGTFKSVADVTSAETLAQVRQYKKEMKARARAAEAT
jgi:uncharacterized HhH-GPD family protein